MEKIIYALWRREGESREAFNQRLRDEAAPRLLALPNVKGLRLNLQDDAVARAEPLRQQGLDPQMDAAAQLWVEVSHEPFRAPIDAVLREASGKIAAWTVLESTIIPNRQHPSTEGARTEGWSQVCFIQRPDRLQPEEWRRIWQDSHTRVGIDTQANFEYVQNLVIRPLIEGSQTYAAIVEECFPTDAMDSAHVFYDAVGDDAKLKRNLQEMIESCARFIDAEAGGIDVLPTSQYEYRKLVDA